MTNNTLSPTTWWPGSYVFCISDYAGILTKIPAYAGSTRTYAGTGCIGNNRREEKKVTTNRLDTGK